MKMVAEEVIITLSGGAPWGFRLQGGVEHQKPLQVAKVRKRSKACRAGLREADELVSINDKPCGTLSHAQAMDLIDSSPGILHIRVKRVPAGFQSVVLVTRAPSPRIDKEYRAALRAMSPHHAPVREVHRSRSSLTSGLTSPPGSEAYYGETDSDADVAGYERQRRQKRRSPSNSNPGKPVGRASPEGGETSEMSGYDSAPDAHVFPGLLDGRGVDGDGERVLPGVARREVIYQPPAPGLWSSQTSTETSSIISSADDQGPRDGGQEEDSGFLEPANVPLVSPERAKEALLLGSRSQLVPMVGPVNKPIDEELTTTYMEKAKQATNVRSRRLAWNSSGNSPVASYDIDEKGMAIRTELNRGDTQQDKHVKEAKSKCRTIASLLTDAPNPHSKGVLMFKKRRQRSKKYTLTSFGSVDEDRCLDSQEEDGVFPGSESEFDEDGFSSVPDPTWDSDYLDMLEKRATAGTEGRGDGAEDARSPGLSNTAGKGAQLFEQQRKRAAEHAKKLEAAQPQSPPQSQVQEQTPMHHLLPETQPQMQPYLQPQQMAPPGPPVIQQELSDTQDPVAAHGISNGGLSHPVISTACVVMSPPPVAPKPATASVTVLSRPTPPAETPLPELPASNVLNRTARPFTPGFISIRAATAPVTFRPSVTKTSPRPASAAVVPPPFSTASELNTNAASITSLPPPEPQPVMSPPSSRIQAPFAPTPEAPVTFHPPAMLVSAEKLHASPPITTIHHAPVATIPPVCALPLAMAPQAPMTTAPVSLPPQIPYSAETSAPLPPLVAAPVVAQPLSPQFSVAPVAAVSAVSQPEAVAHGPTGRTGILLEARRRGGKPKPMFNIPDVTKKSPNPDLLSMVQRLDDRSVYHKRSQPMSEAVYDGGDEDVSGEVGAGRAPPPVAPKPRVMSHETPQFLQAGGKGAELFARRQSRMGMYVVDTPPETPYQQEVTTHSAAQLLDTSNPSLSSQFKYSPNVRAPPPIGYNPLLAPSIPTGPQRDVSRPEGRGRGSQKDGIKALDFMRRQPYQLNSAMFNYGGSATNLSAMPSYQGLRQQHGDYTTMVGSSLTPPRQIPVKTARVFEVKRFSTPTPMSAPTLTPKVIAPRSATSIGERLTHSDMTSPPPAPFNPAPLFTPAPVIAPKPTSPPAQPAGLPSLPKFSATPIPNPVPHSVPTPYTPVSYNTGLQTAKQFQSAPELSILASLPPLKSNPVQAPKPRFVATKGGVQPRVWRPGAM